MILHPNGCLFPNSNTSGLQVQQCTPETCSVHNLHSVVSARCPVKSLLNTTFSLSHSHSNVTNPISEFIQTRCVLNLTTRVFYWFPLVENCVSTSKGDVPYFYGSIYDLQQLQRALQSNKTTTVTVKEKPLMSLAVGMSALSVVVLIIILFGIFHKNSPETTTQQERLAAVRRRTRIRNRQQQQQNETHTSVGIQAEGFLDRTFVPPAISPSSPSPTRHAERIRVNDGFHDSEALLSQSDDPTSAYVTGAVTYAVGGTSHDGDVIGITTAAALTACRLCNGTTGVVAERGGIEEESQRSPFPSVPGIMPHQDTSSANRISSFHPKIFKGTPCLPNYEDAAKRGMYCIIRESDITVPPPYQRRQPHGAASPTVEGDGDNLTIASSSSSSSSPHPYNIFGFVSSWEFHDYGVHRGSVNSLPAFSRIYAPPESPYPGDTPP